jgi:hypothetical protein
METNKYENMCSENFAENYPCIRRSLPPGAKLQRRLDACSKICKASTIADPKEHHKKM